MTTIQRRTLFLRAAAALGAPGMLFGTGGWLGLDLRPLARWSVCWS
jgi:hypothetical protein